MQKFFSFVRKHKNRIWLVGFICMLAYGAHFAIVLGCDAYPTAKEYVFSSEEINNTIGKIEDVNIAIGFNVKGGVSVSGGTGKAHYYLNVLTNQWGVRPSQVDNSNGCKPRAGKGGHPPGSNHRAGGGNSKC